MDRVQWIEHKGKKILLLDYSNLNAKIPEQKKTALDIIAQARKVTTAHKGKIFFLSDVSNSQSDTELVDALREFAKRIRRFSEASIPVLLLIGNHDLPLAAGKAASTEIFSILDVPKVVVADKIATHLIDTKSGPVQIVTLPWPGRSHLLTRGELRGKSADEVTDELAGAEVEVVCSMLHVVCRI